VDRHDRRVPLEVLEVVFQVGWESSVGTKKTGKGRRKIGSKKRRMRSKIRHRKKWFDVTCAGKCTYADSRPLSVGSVYAAIVLWTLGLFTALW